MWVFCLLTALSALIGTIFYLSAFSAKQTSRDRGWHIDPTLLTQLGHGRDRNPAVQQTYARRARRAQQAGRSLSGSYTFMRNLEE
jgi:hypothetical protein